MADIATINTASLPAGAGGALTRVGGNTTEATTTSNTATDLMTISSISILGSTPWQLTGAARKTTGAAANAALGLTINATVVSEASSGGATFWRTGDGGDQITMGSFWLFFPSTLTSYTQGGINMYMERTNNIQAGVTGTADASVATITTIVIRGVVANTSITVAVDEVHIYSYATS